MITRLVSPIKITGDKVTILDEHILRTVSIDQIVHESVFGLEQEKQSTRWLIWELARELGIYPASILGLYSAIADNKVTPVFTVPAMNIRGLIYDVAQTVFNVAKDSHVGAFVFELARSEMKYTFQTPEEYVCVLLAAAIKTGWQGPVFIQGDHFQPKAVTGGVPATGEIDALKALIAESVTAGIYNIDVDASTLVDLEKNTVSEQQAPNVKYSLELFKYATAVQPKGIKLSLGGEIGHIGGKNSTQADLDAYMAGLLAGGETTDKLQLKKISVQTGTSHGGQVGIGGNILNAGLDLSVLTNLTKIGREKYNLAGCVQHGASTLPDMFFSHFPKSGAVEIHLATGFQNFIFDHPDFPSKLLADINAWIDNDLAAEKDPSWSDMQARYKLRKKAWGKFKRELWYMDRQAKSKIMWDLGARFKYIFDALNVIDTQYLVKKYVKPVEVRRQKEEFGKKSVIVQATR